MQGEQNQKPSSWNKYEQNSAGKLFPLFFFDNFFKLKVLQKQQNERKENDLIAVPEKWGTLVKSVPSKLLQVISEKMFI